MTPEPSPSSGQNLSPTAQCALSCQDCGCHDRFDHMKASFGLLLRAFIVTASVAFGALFALLLVVIGRG